MAFLTYNDISGELNGADKQFVSLLLDEISSELSDFGLNLETTEETDIFYSPDSEFGSSSIYLGNLFEVAKVVLVKKNNTNEETILKEGYDFHVNKNILTGAWKHIYFNKTVCPNQLLKIRAKTGYDIDWSTRSDLRKAIINYIKYKIDNKDTRAIKSARTGDSSVTFETTNKNNLEFSDTKYFKAFAKYL